MECDINLFRMPLSSLPYKTRNLLTCLLDTPKILPTDEPDKLPRDWRGLASLVNISSEIAASIKEFREKTTKVLEIWVLRQDGTATVGQLLKFLQQLDRYDIHDDILQDLKDTRNGLSSHPINQVAIQQNQPMNNITVEDEYELITYDDSPGHIQQYHAFVLYAIEDKEFVDEMLKRLRAEGFSICTVDDLLPGHPTPYGPVANLISQRCQRIILIFSPDFLVTAANVFYRDYAQALSIDKSQRKIIPIMYRQCQLPMNLLYYHRLYYSSEGKAMCDFWVKLKQSLEKVQLPGLTGPPSIHSGVNIIELTNNTNGYANDNHLFLTSPQQIRSVSMSELQTLQVNSVNSDDSKSLNSMSQASVKKKKSTIRKFISTFTGRRKQKKTLMVEN